MLATVTALDHQSREIVADISANAEEKLRETCTQVFENIGETLQERLQQIARNLDLTYRPQQPFAFSDDQQQLAVYLLQSVSELMSTNSRATTYPASGLTRIRSGMRVPGIMKKFLHTWLIVHICASGRAISPKN